MRSSLCFSVAVMAALFGPAAAQACRNTEVFCERFDAGECDAFSLHLQCPLLCGACTLPPTAAPTAETPAGIFRSGLNLNIESASGGDVSIDGHLWHDVVRNLGNYRGPRIIAPSTNAPTPVRPFWRRDSLAVSEFWPLARKMGRGCPW